MHLTDEQIQRHLHGELSGEERAAVAEHLSACPACAQAFDAATAEEEAVFDVLHAVDHAPPAVDARDLLRARFAPAATWLRRAAVVVLVAAVGGAAYAIPGSPVRGLVKQLARALSGAGEPAGPTPPPEPVISGITVPAGERFAVRFVAPQDGASVRLRWIDRDDVSVRALGDAVTFAVSADGLTIDNTGSRAGYEIDAPRATRVMTVVVAGVEIFSGDETSGPVVLTLPAR